LNLKCMDYNYSAYKYQESIYDAYCEIIEPLLKYFRCKIFYYMKFFPDGTYLSLSNNLSWQKFYFSNILNNDMIQGFRALACYNLTDYVPVLWPKTPNSKITQSLYDQDIWNGYKLMKVSSNCVESWGVCTDRLSSESQEFYIRQKETFLSFIRHFEEKAKDLIRLGPLEDYKLGYYENGTETFPIVANLYSQSLLKEEEARMRTFLCELYKEDRFINVLTPLETKCLARYQGGERASDLSKKFNLPFQTVEMLLRNAGKKIRGIAT